MIGLRLTCCTAQQTRLTLAQKLGIESRFLQSVLPKTESFLQESSTHQRGLKYLRPLEDEDQYRSVLDFLVGVVAPQLRGAIRRYYATGEGQLHETHTSSQIKALDSCLRRLVGELAQVSSQGVKRPRKEDLALWLDWEVRPAFAFLEPGSALPKCWGCGGGLHKLLPHHCLFVTAPIGWAQMIEPP